MDSGQDGESGVRYPPHCRRRRLASQDSGLGCQGFPKVGISTSASRKSCEQALWRRSHVRVLMDGTRDRRIPRLFGDFGKALLGCQSVGSEANVLVTANRPFSNVRWRLDTRPCGNKPAGQMRSASSSRYRLEVHRVSVQKWGDVSTTPTSCGRCGA